MTVGTVVIAAHNEETVIARTLDSLSEVTIQDHIRVIVVCNGCSDRTADVARRYPKVIVTELTQASKAAALREGDRRAGPGPRIYLDADIVLTSRGASDVIHALNSGVIAARPVHVFDSDGASRIVRSWYEVRQSISSISGALWGAGCYALSVSGRQRFDEFPEIISDDLFIDSLFSHDEIAIVVTDPVVVKTPRRTADLLRILNRSYRTQSEIRARAGLGLSSGQRGQLLDLWNLLRKSPRRIGDILIYIFVIIIARCRVKISGSSAAGWERDDSSR